MSNGPGVEFWLPSTTEPIDPGKYRPYAASDDSKFRSGPQEVVVQLPFLDYPADSSSKTKLSGPKPWVYKQGTQPVAVFGVAGSTLLDGVSKLNSMWLYWWQGGIDKHREVRVQSADAAETLRQVFQYCESDVQCSQAHKVLLAQMPQEEAYDLISRISKLPITNNVELIVAQADPDRETGDRDLVRTLSGRQQSFGLVVVTPGSHFRYKQPYQSNVHVNAATVIPNLKKNYATCEAADVAEAGPAVDGNPSAIASTMPLARRCQ